MVLKAKFDQLADYKMAHLWHEHQEFFLLQIKRDHSLK